MLVLELATALAAAGHRVHVVAFGGGDRRSLPPGVRVHVAPAPRLSPAHGPSCRRVLLDVLMLLTLYRVVRTEAVDLIHAHNYEGPIAAYIVRFLTGIPVVYHGHNLLDDELTWYFKSPIAKWVAGRLGRFLDRSIPRRADFVVALTESMAASLRENGVRGDQLAVIPPGLTLQDPPREPLAAAHRTPRTVVYAGNLDPYQDLPTLLRAMSEVRSHEPEARLYIATHADSAQLGRFRHRWGLDGETVEVVGISGIDEMWRILRSADVLVCPRSSWSGFPMKLLNYLAAGRPIVAAAGAATAIGSFPIAVFPNNDAAQLASRIIEALRDDGARLALSREAQVRVRERHSWDRLLPAVLAVYGGVVRGMGEGSRVSQECEKLLQNAPVWELMGE